MERLNCKLLIAAYDRDVERLLREGGIVPTVAPELVDPDALPGLEGSPDLVVVDCGPGGASAARALRDAGIRAPVLVLLPRDDVSARVTALDSGADDCLGKPVDPQELAARVRALIRRPAEARTQLRFQDLVYDLSRQEVRRNGRPVEVTAREARLLELFLRNPRQVLPRELIVERVWGDPARSNAVDVYVGYLRRKLEANGEARLLHTVRGVGYVLADSASRTRS
jgi:two-component system response regulator MprA